MSTTGVGSLSDEIRNVGSFNTLTPSGNQETWSLASQFGRLSYKLFDRYILTGTVRRDGSSGLDLVKNMEYFHQSPPPGIFPRSHL